MARQERSAGFIVYRVDETSRRLYLALDQGQYWGLPKGHLDEGEDDLTAAIRELREETGISDARIIDGFKREIEYTFHSRRKGTIQKAVAFFLCQTKSSEVVLSHEHVAYEYLPYPEALKRFTYASTREIVMAAEELLQRIS